MRNRLNMKEMSGHSLIVRFSQSVLLLLIFTIAFSYSANAQEDIDDTAPPPLKVFSKVEKTRLSSCKDTRERTKAALGLMGSRLAAAEQLMAAKDFVGVFNELGAFSGLLDDQLDYMIRTDNDSGRALDNFKRLEIGLRAFMPRIETIRRELPLKYESYTRGLEKFVRDARSRALEPLFSNTVIREPGKPMNL